ncbi:MAG: O-acetyl-ADP-ribose deacetylase [Bacteroidetes bacterium]|nr:O-acetyl-ADP-ribose deacetylase [Bacteroidota bacterium]MBU1719367.1 O-acetyl-ADP-ribose deacetylase [Bacteroidota bacterium]
MSHYPLTENFRKIQLVLGDLTQQNVEAIVNAANNALLGGGGVDGAIHRAAGQGLIEECRTLNGCETGDAKITKGYNLLAKHVIHTVGPVWRGGMRNEPELLASCYRRSLDVALENGIKTIAFPNISTGVYGFPKPEATKIAIQTVFDFLNSHNEIERIVFVCFDNENYSLYASNLGEIRQNFSCNC